jgi:O-antigen/teichoic acid export membrane protein
MALNFERPAFLGILAGAAGYVAYSLHMMLFGLFQQKLRQHGVVIAEIVGGVALVALVVVLIRAGAGPVWFVAALGASYGITLMLSLFFANRLVPLRPAVDLASWRRLAWFALPLAAVESMTEIYFRADSVLIALLHSPEMVGLYGVPAKVMDATLGILTLLVGLFAPLFARSAFTDPAEFSRYVQQALSVLAMGSFAAAVLLMTLSNEVVVLIGGAAFADSAGILAVLSLVIVSHSAIYLLREAAVALNMQRRLIPIYLAGTVTAFACYVPLISRYGGVGAAASILVAELLVFGLLYRLLCGVRLYNVSLRVPALACLSGAAAVGATASIAWLDGHWWIRSGGALVLYGVMLLATRALSLSELTGFCRGMLSRR